jgi:co-chaperonin GroES (HSP10)
MKALNYVVIVKESHIQNITASGLDITSESDKNEKYRKGTIVSFGELCPKVDGKHTIEVGQEVLFDNYKASDLIIDGNHYKTFYYADLVALI